MWLNYFSFSFTSFFIPFKNHPNRFWATPDHPGRRTDDLEVSVLEALAWESSAQKLAVFYSEADWGGHTQTQDHSESRVLAAGFPERRAGSPRWPLFISDSSTPKVRHHPGFPLR